MPKSPPAAAAAPPSPVLRVFRYLRRYPWLAAGTLFCAVGTTVTVAVFPGITQRVVDEVIRAQRPGLLGPLLWIGLAAFVLQNGLDALRIVLNNTVEQRVIFDLRSDLYAHIQRLPLSWFDDRATGDLMTRVLEDVNSVERVLVDGVEQGLVASLQIVVVLVMLSTYSLKTVAVALVPLPFLVGGALAYTLTAHRRYKQQRQAASTMNALLHDNLSGIRQIKTYVRETEEHRRFNQASAGLRQATLVIMGTWAVYSPSMEFFNNCGLLLVLGVGGADVLHGRLALGEFVAILTLVRFLYEPTRQLHSLNQLVQAGRAAGARVFEIMDTPAEPDEASEGLAIAAAELAAGRRAPFAVRGEVRYQDVSFSYGEDRPVLRHVSLIAPAGQTIALVGPTGAGKSTLVNLLTRFYEYDQGEITVDGRPLREIPKPLLRAAVGLVTQESFLFNGTVRDNLRLGKPDAADEELWAAVTAANARSFLERLPQGLDTVVGERGVKLSVGEKQRVSIARALLKDPPILVLDEATASVDTQTERAIQQALDRLMRGRTSFVIAHRLSTVRRAHQILVLDHGRIVERGTHAELVALPGGLYARLYESSLFREDAGEPVAATAVAPVAA